MKRLPLLFGLVVLFTAVTASACSICVPYMCPDPEYWWDCAYCDSPPPGYYGSIYCAMWPDGSCATGNINCIGPSRPPGDEASATFNKTWRVASVRTLTPAAPVAVAENRAPRR